MDSQDTLASKYNSRVMRRRATLRETYVASLLEAAPGDMRAETAKTIAEILKKFGRIEAILPDALKDSLGAAISKAKDAANASTRAADIKKGGFFADIKKGKFQDAFTSLVKGDENPLANVFAILGALENGFEMLPDLIKNNLADPKSAAAKGEPLHKIVKIIDEGRGTVDNIDSVKPGDIRKSDFGASVIKAFLRPPESALRSLGINKVPYIEEDKFLKGIVRCTISELGKLKAAVESGADTDDLDLDKLFDAGGDASVGKPLTTLGDLRDYAQKHLGDRAKGASDKEILNMIVNRLSIDGPPLGGTRPTREQAFAVLKALMKAKKLRMTESRLAVLSDVARESGRTFSKRSRLIIEAVEDDLVEAEGETEVLDTDVVPDPESDIVKKLVDDDDLRSRLIDRLKSRTKTKNADAQIESALSDGNSRLISKFLMRVQEKNKAVYEDIVDFVMGSKGKSADPESGKKKSKGPFNSSKVEAAIEAATDLKTLLKIVKRVTSNMNNDDPVGKNERGSEVTVKHQLEGLMHLVVNLDAVNKQEASVDQFRDMFSIIRYRFTRSGGLVDKIEDLVDQVGKASSSEEPTGSALARELSSSLKDVPVEIIDNVLTYLRHRASATGEPSYNLPGLKFESLRSRYILRQSSKHLV